MRRNEYIDTENCREISKGNWRREEKRNVTRKMSRENNLSGEENDLKRRERKK